MNAQALAWYARRLRVMGTREILWRGGRALASARRPQGVVDAPVPVGDAWQRFERAFRAGEGRPVLLDRARARQLAERVPDEAAAAIELARRWQRHRVTFFAGPEVDLGAPIDWNRDPTADYRWPNGPSHRVDTRGAPADPKWIWELHRLQQLPLLTQAWLMTGEEGFAEEAIAQIESWLEQCPVGTGIGWKGGFETGMRIVSLAIAVQGLRDAPDLTTDLLRRIAAVLGASARRAWSERSLHSSANNHLVGELAGVCAVATLYPELPGLPALCGRALPVLAEAAEQQFHADGVGAEQSYAYQVFAGEMLLTIVALRPDSGESARILAALHRSGRFLADLLGTEDPMPRVGDDDEGWSLRLDGNPLRDPRGHIGAIGALTEDPACKRSGRLDLQARWIVGAAGEERWERTTADAAPESRAPGPGGIAILRAGPTRVTVDVGPLGYLAICAHGHADALAVTLANEGVELVGDPGTGSYYRSPEWRRAHRSTPAHATVTVDGEDQAEMGGPFLWTRHVTARVLSHDPDGRWVVGVHDGYLGLPGKVEHRRAVALVAPGEVVVIDVLTGGGAHTARCGWPIHPDLSVAEGPAPWRTYRGAGSLAIASVADVALEPFLIRADEQSGLGWWSERLDARRPSDLVGVQAAFVDRAVIATALVAHGGTPSLELDAGESIVVRLGSTRVEAPRDLETGLELTSA